MDRDFKNINNMLVNIFNLVEKLEEESIQGSSFENVSIKEIHTLVAIGNGRPKTMTHIAGILGISVSTLTTAINKLVKKELARRFRDEGDRRIVRIALTDAGREIAEKHDGFHATLVKEAMGYMDDDNKDSAINLLSNIERYLQIQTSGYKQRTELRMDPIELAGQTLPVPLVQAGMSIGIAGDKLAAAVATNGGLGLIALTDIGYMEPDYDKYPVKANKRAIKRKVSQARQMVEEAGGKGLIGVNIMWNTDNAHDYVETAVKAGAQVVVTSAGMPHNLPRYITDKKVALIPTVSTRRGAKAIITSWSRRYNRLPDAFILQSPTAAGLLGFKEEELEFAIQEWHKSILGVKSELSKLENCPLIVGGSIFDRHDAETVYRCGADAFLMGSRFVATEECDAPESYKNLYLNCNANDVTIVNSPMKAVVRVMNNKFARELAASGRSDYDIIKAVRDGIKGDYENGLIFCGSHPDKITKIDTVANVFSEFTR